jgi:hypothetical protein
MKYELRHVDSLTKVLVEVPDEPPQEPARRGRPPKQVKDDAEDDTQSPV